MTDFIHLVWESAAHLSLDVISELIEGQSGGSLEVSQALLSALHVQDVTEVGGKYLQ